MVMFGNDAAGPEFDFGDARAIFYEQDFLRATGQHVQATFFIPFRRSGGAGSFILHEFDCHIAEGG